MNSYNISLWVWVMLYRNVWYISHVLDLENVQDMWIHFLVPCSKCNVAWSCEISGTQRKCAVNNHLSFIMKVHVKDNMKFLILQRNVLCILSWKCTWNGKFPSVQGNVLGRWHFLSIKLQQLLSSKFHSKISFIFPSVF